MTEPHVRLTAKSTRFEGLEVSEEKWIDCVWEWFPHGEFLGKRTLDELDLCLKIFPAFFAD